MTLTQWQQQYGSKDSLGAGFAFPLKRDEQVIVNKGFHANRYLKGGTILTFRGLGACGQVLFQTADGKWVKLSGQQLNHVEAQ